MDTAAQLLTGPRAGDLLEAALAIDHVTLGSWRVHQVHARPGAEVSVGYEVTVRGETDGARTPPGRPEYLVATTADLPPDVVERRGILRLVDGEQTVHVWRHPVDPLLPGLATACDPAVLTDRWRSLDPHAPLVLGLDLVTYRPLRRAVLRARTTDGDVYLKVVRPDRVTDLRIRHDLFLVAEAAPMGYTLSAPPAAPRVLASLGEGILVLAARPEETLASAIASTPRHEQPLTIDPHELLRALVALPQDAALLERRVAWAERSEHYARAAVGRLPGHTGRIEALERSLRRIVADRDPGPVVATHGDFYEANVLLVGGAGCRRVAAVLDVDTLGPGHRIDDLACMTGHLAVLETLAPQVYPGVQGLVDRCLAVFGEATDPIGLRARSAGVVLSLLPGAPREALAEAWLGVAEELLAGAETRLRVLSRPAPAPLTSGSDCRDDGAAARPLIV
ncbi:phosphotransferase family protein [Oerskovia sp. USHLN155]|uniref:phosphotransferase family protein n=1 Tax=Oerskovia sp. USHLN155 TaxID=3081288 RepID=UPI003015FD85